MQRRLINPVTKQPHTETTIDWTRTLSKVKDLQEPAMDFFPDIEYKYVAVDMEDKGFDPWPTGIMRPLDAMVQQRYYDYVCRPNSGVTWWDALDTNEKVHEHIPIELKKRVGYNVATLKTIFLVDFFVIIQICLSSNGDVYMELQDPISPGLKAHVIYFW